MLKIPTDNLYKFMAVTGLVIFIYSSSLAYLYQMNIDRQWSAFQVKNTDMDNYIANLSKNARTAFSSGDESEIVSFMNTVNNAPEKAKRIIEKQEDASKDLEVAQLQKSFQENYKAYLDSETKRIRRLSIVLWVGAIAGLIFSIIGFVAWYFQVQRHLDKGLLLEHDDSRNY